MILKLLSIVVLMDLVQSSPQIPVFNNVPGIIGGLDKSASGIADTVVDTGKNISNTVEGLIKNFNDFKTTFKKNYVDKAEELLREKVFNASLALINDHNKLFEQGKVAFALGMNFFGDWTHDEYLKILGTQTLNNTNTNGTNHRNKRQTRESDCKFPVEKDWRKDGAVTPVKYQEQCGSCWAFAAVATLESHFFIKNKKLSNFSEQQLLDCSSENLGCNGGWVNEAYEYVKRNGIVTDDQYPYVAKEKGEGSCSKLQSGQKISNYRFITNGNEADLKDAVCRIGPVAIAVDASSDNFQFYKKGIYSATDCSNANINHAMAVVGYGVEENTKEPYWIVKNSYSTAWGEDGFIRYRRDFNSLCGIADDAFILES